MDFITIDFETATPYRNSACEIGLTFVENKEVVKTESWLIQPPDNEYSYFNKLIHGIEPTETADAPSFAELWQEIHPLIEGKLLIAHNASFDMSVLRNTLAHYDIPFPNLEYSCSYIFSRNVWKGLPAYDLATLCNHNNIEFQHHRAGPDSLATAELTIKAFEKEKITDKIDFSTKLKASIGILYEDGYKPSRSLRPRISSKRIDISKLEGDPDKHQEDNIFYESMVVFTGKMGSMSRTSASQTIVDIGGKVGERVTQKTNFLVVGQQDYRVVGQGGMSSKQRRALELIEQGFDIEVLSEIEFIRNLEQ